MIFMILYQFQDSMWLPSITTSRSSGFLSKPRALGHGDNA
jgi:hypothetical protein